MKTKNGSSDIPVDRLEWTLPSEWSSGNNIVITDRQELNVTTDYFREATIKVRGVNTFYPEDKTNYSEIKIKRQFSFEEYPSSVKYGES